jgi:predicted Rossmann fold flavoprotein
MTQPSMTHSFDAIILGGGAAGLMCAIEAGKRGRRVAVLDHADRLGKKILISGGGRCNFTNLHCRPENFLSSNPHFAKSALARYTPADFIALVEKHGIPYHEKTLGQLFCDRSARDILGMLESECQQAGVSIFLNAKVGKVGRATEFVLTTADEEFHAAALVVATGGLSIPKIGATSFGYDLARQFGLDIVEPWPGLVPLVLNKEDCSRYCELAGVSAEVIASGAGQRFREKMLITHRGLSGPAVLQISSYWKKGQSILIDLAPEREVTAAFSDPKVPRSVTALRAELRKVLPQRLADRWLDEHAPASWTNQSLADLERKAHAWAILPAETEGYEKAEVTAGGVDTGELSAKTMESRKASGLFFIGEVVDVTGHLGGFNFQWAWASGAAAGRAL